MSVQQSLTNFAEGVSRRAICLHGPWGVGKTHLWNSVVEKSRADQTYVSLFGIDSLDGLKVQVALASQDQAAVKWHRRKYYFKDLWRWITRGTSLVPSEFGGGEQLAAVAQSLAFYFVKDRLICIDDVERRGSNLRLRDVFGLVSHLEERRNCRVCVILNSGALTGADAQEWAEQREKVFEVELFYDPGVNEAIKIALGDGDQLQQWYSDAVDALAELAIRNVRIIRRIARSLELVFDELGAIHGTTIRQVVRDVVFLEYCNCGSALGAPTLDFVSVTSPMALAVDRINRGQGESRYSSVEEAWAEKISRYNIDSSDRLTKLLSEGVAAGYPASGLRELTEGWDREARSNASHERFSASWRRYRNDLSAEKDEVLSEMLDSWSDVVSTESAMNANGFARLLRAHERDDLASRVISEWISARSGERVGELQEEAVSFFGEITDPEFRSALDEARQNSPLTMALDDALNRIRDREGNEESFGAVAMADMSELASALTARADSFALIKELLDRRSSSMDVYSRAGRNVEEALLQIASKSRWNAVRIKSTYGVYVE